MRIWLHYLFNFMPTILDFLVVSLKKFFLTLIYFWERQTEHKSGVEEERERVRESEAVSRLWAVSTQPNTGLELMSCEIMTWAKVRHWLTEPPRCPNFLLFLKFTKDPELLCLLFFLLETFVPWVSPWLSFSFHPDLGCRHTPLPRSASIAYPVF